MLNPVAKKWVKALRSGKYKQGRGYLRTEKDEYCCLGVLCDLAVKAKIIPKPSLGNRSRYVYGFNNQSLPVKAEVWAGVWGPFGSYIKRGGGQTDLAAQNDEKKKTFAQIADIIESEPEGLFVK